MEGMRRHERRERPQSFTWQELSQLPTAERKEIMQHTAQEIINALKSKSIEYENLNQFYQVLRGEDMIVRRDAPDAILSAIEDGAPLKIDFPEGERYSNAVIWSPRDGVRGLENAYLEGYGHANGIVTVMGVRRSALSDIVELPDATRQFAGTDRSLVRSVRGSVNPDDILFVTVRIPAEAFPEEAMTDTEAEAYDTWKEAGETQRRPMFIHRGYLFTEHLAKQ